MNITKQEFRARVHKSFERDRKRIEECEEWMEGFNRTPRMRLRDDESCRTALFKANCAAAQARIIARNLRTKKADCF